MHDSPAPATDLLDGRYRLLGVLARGGMATVHRAHDESLGRDVAVKILHPHLTEDATFLDRFRREARAAATLHHPNVVAIYDRGETESDAYLVMELVDGPTLRDVLRLRGRLTPGETLSVLASAASGLAAAHDAGLVHRDVKPENILIDSHTGAVKITDFGLARAAAATTQTFGPDALAGSPHYLSPEAVKGEPLDARSDVYGLGIVLYECLVGRPPFEGETPMATAMSHTTRSVPRPSVTVPGVPGALDEIVLGAAAAERSDRFEDARTFAAALAAAVPSGPEPVDLRDGERHTIVPPTHVAETIVTARPADTSRTRRRRRPWLAAAVLALLALAGLVVWDQVIAPVTDIPDVDGETVSVASAVLRDAGFEVEVDDERRNSLSVPADHVFTYTPEVSARRGSTVTLVLSAGPRPVSVPEVTGMAQEDAVAQLVDAGLVPSIVEEHHEEVARGLVIRAEPSGGVIVDEASTVTVVISDGPAPIDLPSLVMSPFEDAIAALEDLGLVGVIAEREHDDDVPLDWVIAQTPEAGTTLYRGDRVELVVSLGPKKFPMPDVRGDDADAARRELEALGLVVTIEKVSSFLRPEGKVAEQDPAPGKDVKRGDEVTLFVWD